MGVRRIFPLILLIFVLAGVGFATYRSVTLSRAAKETARLAAATHVLRGAIGSEKEAFFDDDAVKAALAKAGFEVHPDRVGSREIAKAYKPGVYAFGWPSGAPAAAELKAVSHAGGEVAPFYTPMVIATWAPIADILAANGVVSGRGQFRKVDMHKLVGLMLDGRRWRDLAGSDAFPVNKAVLVTTTDVRRSNSAAMYLALASYIAHDDSVVDDRATALGLAERIAPLFLRQGFQESSSANPFTDYTAMGMGKTPLLFAYESQVIEYLLKPDAARRSQIVLLYPTPTILSKNVFVPYTDDARRLGALLTTDPVLRDAAHRHGYRLPEDDGVPPRWAKAGIAAPATMIDVIDPPSFETLETMIGVIEGKLK
ncbi:MAG: hypothetical protein JWR77_1512 [Rhizorhabdus sp.]|nr:hypothetical protein [Rhizorhabdus sp.]